MAYHRVSVVSTGLRRFPDPERSSDPKVQSLLGQLAVLEIAPPPRAHFRAELRAQLVAVAPRLVVEGAPELVKHTPESLAAAEAREPSGVRAVSERARRLRFGRPLAIVGTGFAVAVLAVSGTVYLSRNALPGDTLYGVKRTAESVQYSFTSGTDARAKEQLHFASTRAHEVQELLGNATALALSDGPNAADAINAHTAELITKTLGAADSDVQQAARMLGTEAVQQQSVQPLAIMTHWLPGQKDRMSEIVDRIPQGTLHERAVQSEKLLDLVGNRAIAIAKASDCATCLKDATHDQLGPNPTADGALPNSGPASGAPSITAGTAAPGAPGAATASGAPAPGSVLSGRGGNLPTALPTGVPSYAAPNAPTSGPIASVTSGLGNVGSQLNSAASGAGSQLSSGLNSVGSAVHSVVNDLPVVGAGVNGVVNTEPSPTKSCAINAKILGLPVNALC